MRPCFAKRQTIPSSVFLSSFFFVRLESFSASFLMKLAAFFVIGKVAEFPIDVRQPSNLRASCFPLVLVITCLYEHRSTGEFFHTYRAVYRLGGEDSVIPSPGIPDVCYHRSGYLVITDMAFHVEYYSTLIGARQGLSRACVNATPGITSTRAQSE